MSKVKIRYTAQVEVDIDLKKVEDYLISKGWVDDGPYGRWGQNFSNADIDGVVILPTTDKVSDLNGRMTELIQEVASAEGRTVPELLEDLTCK